MDKSAHYDPKQFENTKKRERNEIKKSKLDNEINTLIEEQEKGFTYLIHEKLIRLSLKHDHPILKEYLPKPITSQTNKKYKERRKEFSASICRDVLLKQKGLCNVCHKFFKTWDFDHMDEDPSNNKKSNCQALCRNCHGEKSRKHRDSLKNNTF